MDHALAATIVAVAAGLEDIEEPDDIRLDIVFGMGDAMAHAGLGGEVDDHLRMVGGEETVDGLLVGDVALDEVVVDARRTQVLELVETRLLEAHVVVVVEVVNADDGGAVEGLHQTLHEVAADEPGTAGDEICGHGRGGLPGPPQGGRERLARWVAYLTQRAQRHRALLARWLSMIRPLIF